MQEKDSGSRDLNLIRLLAGVLLLYFAWELLSGFINAESSSPVLSICGCALFAVCGGGLIYWELKMHRLFLGKGKKASSMDNKEDEKALDAESESEPHA